MFVFAFACDKYVVAYGRSYRYLAVRISWAHVSVSLKAIYCYSLLHFDLKLRANYTKTTNFHTNTSHLYWFMSAIGADCSNKVTLESRFERHVWHIRYDAISNCKAPRIARSKYIKMCTFDVSLTKKKPSLIARHML